VVAVFFPRYVQGHLFAGALVGPPETARRASFAAYDEAGTGPHELNTVQVHDAYAIEELLYYGLAQIWELAHQVRGTAGPRQVDGAKVGLAHIIGAGSVCFAHILVDGR
jgi:acetyl-CoA acetyltransferase